MPGTIKVVLAEDHALMRDAVKLVFDEAEDVELVGEVANGHDLLPLLAKIAADFVLLDVQLPGVDGLGCLEALAEHHPQLKVAMLSAVEDPQVIESAFRRGARSYILKSVNPFDLPAAIRQIVDESVIHRPRAVPERRRRRAPAASPRRRWRCSSSSATGTRTSRSPPGSG